MCVVESGRVAAATRKLNELGRRLHELNIGTTAVLLEILQLSSSGDGAQGFQINTRACMKLQRDPGTLKHNTPLQVLAASRLRTVFIPPGIRKYNVLMFQNTCARHHIAI